MNPPSLRDVEQLSAYLDGQLSGNEMTRLESRLAADPALAAALEELGQARAVLRRTPRRRAPRSFALTPQMAGLRPPVPRAVPALSWASAVAMLVFVCTLGTGLLGGLPLGAGAPAMAGEAPLGMGGGGAYDSGTQGYGIGGGPAATEESVAPEAGLPTATAEATELQVPEPTPGPMERTAEQPPAGKTPTPLNLWLLAWPGLAALLIGTATLVRWKSLRAFRKRLRR